VQMKGKCMIKSRKVRGTLAAAALCVASAGWAVAQAQEASTDQAPIPQPAPTATTPAQPDMKSRCSQLIGARVENQNGEKLGTIADVVVSVGNERVSYCVLKVKHGILSKARLVEVPLAAFQPSADGSYLILNASKANLASAKGFDPNMWPAAINPVWGAEPETPVEVPPTEVVGVLPTITVLTPKASPLVGFGLSQRPGPMTANEAIDQIHWEYMYGTPDPVERRAGDTFNFR